MKTRLLVEYVLCGHGRRRNSRKAAGVPVKIFS